MTNAEFHRLANGAAQNSIVYRALLAARGSWVTARTLKKLANSANVCSRCKELRNMGLPIDHNRQMNANSAYRMRVLP